MTKVGSSLHVVTRERWILEAALAYNELLRKLNVKLRPVDPDVGPIIFVIHRNTHIGSIILEAMLRQLERENVPVDGHFKSYSMSNMERAKMSPYFEKANFVLLLDHPEISPDVYLYDELRALWTKPTQ